MFIVGLAGYLVPEAHQGTYLMLAAAAVYLAVLLPSIRLLRMTVPGAASVGKSGRR